MAPSSRVLCFGALAPLVSAAVTPPPRLRGSADGHNASEVLLGDVAQNTTDLAAWWWGGQGPSLGSCVDFGCPAHFLFWAPCQCNGVCQQYGNCCSDVDSCGGSHGSAPTPSNPPSPPSPPSPTSPTSPAPPPSPSTSPSAPSPAPTPAAPGKASSGELQTFYVYRSQNNMTYPLKNDNAANLEGTMWYLQHEVVTQVPPKFGIVRIIRYRVSTRAPQRLLAAGMHFGVRYAYDSQKCTGPGNCTEMYERYGYFVGCNNFASMYPYPDQPTAYPGGVWYSFPGEGACSGTPTGEDSCTYSYSWPPEEILLADLEGSAGHAFWDKPHDEAANAKKVQAAAELFKKKYPESPDLSDPTCDFDYGRFGH